MKQRFSRRSEIFVVRLWAEYLDQSPPAWRGEIEHVEKKQVMHFRTLEEMVEKMRSLVSLTDQADGRSTPE